jgi:WXG100 family type VII secretion target
VERYNPFIFSSYPTIRNPEEIVMTTLRMEVEIAESAKSKMDETYNQCSSLMSSLNGAVSSLQASWQGNSATEFQGVYDTWKSNMNTTMENLQQMASRLQNEITEWKNMAEKLA